jgi:hypothetical protein
MKNFTKISLLLVAMMFFGQLASAQTVGKGGWMIGGSAGFSSQKYKDADKSTSYLSISPSLGYYFADDFAVLLGVDFTNTSFDGSSSSTFSLAPGLRYYVTDPIFVQAVVDLGLNDGAGTSFDISVGYSWFLNNSVAIEPALFFSSSNNDGDNNDFTTFGLSIGIQAFLQHDHGME